MMDGLLGSVADSATVSFRLHLLWPPLTPPALPWPPFSMGREPVTVNGAAVESPQELQSGDRIEVHLETRTRTFFFQTGGEDTLQIASPGSERAPLSERNAEEPAATVAAAGAKGGSARRPQGACCLPGVCSGGGSGAGRERESVPSSGLQDAGI